MPERVRCIRIQEWSGELGGTVSWEEYSAAHSIFLIRNRHKVTYQLLSAERLAELGGFGYAALEALLGRQPETWEPDPQSPDDSSPEGA